MEDTEKRLLKNKQISQTKQETIERHTNMLCKTFDVKIQENKLSSKQKEALLMIFIEAKWYKNYILNWTEQSPDNKIIKFNTKISEITHKDKDGNDIAIKLTYFSASQRQCLISQMYANIKTLHILKEKGLQKPGKLKFVSEVTDINLKQYGMTHKIVSSKRVKVQGIPKFIPVNGLNQFMDIHNIEFANARLLKKPTGYYIQFVVYVSKEKENENEKIDKTIGIDFGCSTAFTTSEGEKVVASIQESERLKRLQRTFAKTQKGSKNRYRVLNKLKKEYQKITNQKNDLANKIVHKFSQYETIVIQDEQLRNWQKSDHGKAVQHSVLGRVKAKLLLNPSTVVISKTAPTTKLCRNCGEYHDELKVWNRTFNCECGVSEDRDTHAAKNMVWMYENNVGVGRTKFKRVEMKALVDQIILENQLLSEKHEDSTF
jgi:putative transposase